MKSAGSHTPLREYCDRGFVGYVVRFAALYDYQVEWMHPGKRESDGKIEEVNDVVEIPSKVREHVKKMDLGASYVSEFLYRFSEQAIVGKDEKNSLLEGLCKQRGLVVVDTSRDSDKGTMLHPHYRIWFRLVLKKTNGDKVTKEEVVKNWLAARGKLMRVEPKNTIKIVVKKDGVSEDKMSSLCNVWIDDQGNVNEVYFNEDGMDRIFNAGDLSGEEFAQALVKNYSKIPNLEREGKERVISFIHQNVMREIKIRTTTFIHKNPKGYQVKCFERVFIDDTGLVHNSRMVKNNLMWNYVLDADSSPKKFFAITAIKPESARKFD